MLLFAIYAVPDWWMANLMSVSYTHIIVDIFPLTEEVPVRIELWDDEVDSIRSFDPDSQRSVDQLDTITIYPSAETILTKQQLEAGIERLEKEEKEIREYAVG